MAVISNATSAALPPSCTLCGLSFSLIDAATALSLVLASIDHALHRLDALALTRS